MRHMEVKGGVLRRKKPLQKRHVRGRPPAAKPLCAPPRAAGCLCVGKRVHMSAWQRGRAGNEDDEHGTYGFAACYAAQALRCDQCSV